MQKFCQNSHGPVRHLPNFLYLLNLFSWRAENIGFKIFSRPENIGTENIRIELCSNTYGSYNSELKAK
jgi:hypothetical protein